jgi:hypothetical protein
LPPFAVPLPAYMRIVSLPSPPLIVSATAAEVPPSRMSLPSPPLIVLGRAGSCWNPTNCDRSTVSSPPAMLKTSDVLSSGQCAI